MVPLAPIDCSHKQPKKYLDQLMIASPSDIYLVSSDISSFVDKFVEFTNKDVDVQSLHKLVILLGFLFVFIIRVMKPLHNISEANTT